MATLNIKDLPEDLYQKLRERARRQRRSLSQEVITILYAQLEEDEPLRLLDLKGLGKENWASVEATEHVALERDSWG